MISKSLEFGTTASNKKEQILKQVTEDGLTDVGWGGMARLFPILPLHASAFRAL